MIGRFESLVRVVKTRPFYLGKYIREAVLFTFNYILWQALPRGNVKIGANLHTLTAGIFKAEKPGAFIEVGDDFVGYYGCSISAWGNGRVVIGKCCSMGSGCQIDCRSEIIIGNYTLLSWDVRILDFDAHPVDPQERAIEMRYSHRQLWPQFPGSGLEAAPSYKPTFAAQPIVIGDNVWIGAGAMVLKGVRIGSSSVVAAGSVVTKDVPCYTLVAGNPAIVVKHLKGEQFQQV